MESIKRARKAAGLSLSDVSNRTRLYREVIARVERPGVDLRVSTALTIAKAIGVPICELLDEGAKHERHREKHKATR
jgi:transcriptional regulator with XRE-family HTH domain